MTPQEMIQILKGPADGKSKLFESMLERFMSGENLSDDEIPIFEALKKEFIKPAGKVVELEATLVGSSSQKTGE